MKFVKLSIFALALGVFATSCGETKTEDTMTNDTASMMPMEPAAPMTTDTMMAAPAAGDTSMMMSSPAGDTMKMK